MKDKGIKFCKLDTDFNEYMCFYDQVISTWHQ